MGSSTDDKRSKRLCSLEALNAFNKVSTFKISGRGVEEKKIFIFFQQKYVHIEILKGLR